MQLSRNLNYWQAYYSETNELVIVFNAKQYSISRLLSLKELKDCIRIADDNKIVIFNKDNRTREDFEKYINNLLILALI